LDASLAVASLAAAAVGEVTAGLAVGVGVGSKVGRRVKTVVTGAATAVTAEIELNTADAKPEPSWVVSAASKALASECDSAERSATASKVTVHS